MKYTPPTPEEIERVAAYWQRVKLLSCEHTGGFSFGGQDDRFRCSDCGEPVRIVTDAQLEALRETDRAAAPATPLAEVCRCSPEKRAVQDTLVDHYYVIHGRLL